MSTTLLDDENFKINSVTRQVYNAEGIVHGQRIPIKVKIHPEGDVWEYVSGVPVEFIGQQLFTFTAALRETKKAGKSLPADQEALHDAIVTMPGENELQKYKNYYIQKKIQPVGCYSSGSHIFDDIGIWGYYRLDDGTRINMNTDTRGVARRDEAMGYSIRC